MASRKKHNKNSRKEQNKTSRKKPNKTTRKSQDTTPRGNQFRSSPGIDKTLWTVWSDEQAARLAIVVDLAQLLNDRCTAMERRARELKKLALRKRSTDLPKLVRARHRLHDATRELWQVRRLRGEIQAIIQDAEHRLAVIELEIWASTAAAIARFHAANAARQAHVAHLPATAARDLASELVKAKHATAIVIADRNRMRDELARLAADPELAEEAAEWRRELVVQEAVVDQLKHGLHMVAAAASTAERIS